MAGVEPNRSSWDTGCIAHPVGQVAEGGLLDPDLALAWCNGVAAVARRADADPGHQTEMDRPHRLAERDRPDGNPCLLGRPDRNVAACGLIRTRNDAMHRRQHDADVVLFQRPMDQELRKLLILLILIILARPVLCGWR